MILVLLGLSLVFVAIGYIVTEKNAKNLLSGYNTMTEKERQSFDLKSFIPAFRRFHLFLGISLFVAGSAIEILSEEAVTGIFMTVYPLLAYTWFLWIGKKFYTGQSPKSYRIGLAVLLIVLVFIIALFAVSLRENKISVTSKEITIEGMYGEKMAVSEIESICLTDSLPSILIRTNGFSSGKIRKGYFKTATGEKIKLLLNNQSKPYLRIIKKTGENLYFSSGKIPNQIIYNEIQQKMPALSSH